MKKQVAEFEEETYGYAASFELDLGTASVFKPGLVLEALVGFDAAANPSNAWAWAAIGARAGAGVVLGPSTMPHWDVIRPDMFPPYLVSLFLQYKRPSYSTSPKSRHYGYHGGPYFEFSIRDGQHSVLQRLQATVSSHAVVRYASPAFWRSAELFRFQASASIIQNTCFVAPSRIAGPHRKWTYSGPKGKGLANPEPEETELESWTELSVELIRRAEGQTLVEHLTDIAGQLRRDVAVADYAELSQEEFGVLAQKGVDARAVTDFLTISKAATTAGTDWFVIGFDRLNPGPIPIERQIPWVRQHYPRYPRHWRY